MILYAFILIPIIAGATIYLIPRKQALWFAFALQIGLMALSIYNFVLIRLNGPYEVILGNFAKIAGITLRCDTLTGALMMLTAFIFLVCFLFGLFDKIMNNLFIFFFLTLQALVMTIFLSRDLFNLYVVTEVSTIILAVLIMFKKDSRSMYDGMLYLITNIAAMTFFLFGVAFIYRQFGTLDMNLIGARMYDVANVKGLALPFAFLITGVGLKCAFLPLFSWLPKAHATPSAPSIVSVILSGLYVKCGIYLFIRIREMFLPALELDNIFLIIGILTGVIGFILAMSQNDIKMLLAYSTISQIGIILISITAGGEYAYYGGVLHIFNHAIFKSLLFFSAGIIIKQYGTRNISKIRGVFRRMPYVSLMTLAAMLGITGAPLFNGSISKYFIQSGVKGGIVEYALILINLGTIITFIKFSQMFFGEGIEHRIPIDFGKKASVTIMGAMCIIMGMGGTIVISGIFNFNVAIDIFEYIKKTLVFFVSLGAGYLTYMKYLRKTKFISEGVELELGINGIAISMTTFFVFIMAAVFIVA